MFKFDSSFKRPINTSIFKCELYMHAVMDLRFMYDAVYIRTCVCYALGLYCTFRSTSTSTSSRYHVIYEWWPHPKLIAYNLMKIYIKQHSFILAHWNFIKLLFLSESIDTKSQYITQKTPTSAAAAAAINKRENKKEMHCLNDAPNNKWSKFNNNNKNTITKPKRNKNHKNINDELEMMSE